MLSVLTLSSTLSFQIYSTTVCFLSAHFLRTLYKDTSNGWYKIVVNISLSCILNCIVFLDFSNLYFHTVAVYLSRLESPRSKHAVSVAYGNLIVSTVATGISWPLLLEFLCFIAFSSDVLIHFKCQNNFIIKLFGLCAHFYR